MKTCTACGREGRLADFERWDALCRPCRAEKGPRRLKPAPKPRELHVAVRLPKPKPSGRKAIPRDERAVVVL